MTRPWWKYWERIGHVRKNRVESYSCLDCAKLYDNRKTAPFKELILSVGNGNKISFFADRVLINSLEGRELMYNIPVVTTPCNYGSHRHWFLCPNSSCHRRSRKLYLSPHGFLCRKCLDLAYKSQCQCELSRIIDKKWDLIHKCGGDNGYSVKKPKGMHHKTFDQIQEQISNLDEAATIGIAARFGMGLSF
jgi:hypothetical protein